MTRDKSQKSYIGHFWHNGGWYQHHIFCADDDRVELTDEDNNLFLTFTANCYVYGTKGNQIGHWTTYGGENWKFISNTGRTYEYGSDLLKAEMELSKVWLKGNLE